MPKQLNVRVSDLQFSALDDAVASGRFPSRAAALRRALELLLSDQPEAAPATDEAAPEEATEGESASAAESAESEAVHAPATVAAHPALVEQRVWTWAQERRLPVAVERPALALARRAAVPVLSGATGALLATVVRGAAARRGQARRSVRPSGDGARGALQLFVVTRRG